MTTYGMAVLGEASIILGMKVVLDWKAKTLDLSQKEYALSTLEILGIQD